MACPHQRARLGQQESPLPKTSSPLPELGSWGRLHAFCCRKGRANADKCGMESPPAALALRALEAGDYHKGYLQLLQQLTTVGDVSEAAFADRLRELSPLHGYHIAVLQDEGTGQVVATATLLIEKKLIHACGKVGHIEDVVVDGKYRGRHLGQRIINHLVDTAAREGCYKVILDCAESNSKFYESCGFTRKELQMARYLDQ